MTDPVAIGLPTLPSEESIEALDDLDALLESEQCSCNAGDDNPF